MVKAAQRCGLVLFLFITMLHLCTARVNNTICVTSDQQIITKNYYLFKNNVEILVKGNYHIFADTVFVNKDSSAFRAEGKEPFSVKIETNKNLLFARSFRYDSKKGSGIATNVTIQLHEGYIVAEQAERTDKGIWHLKKALYTPCDEQQPHWRLTADKVKFYDDILDVEKAAFFIGSCPVIYFPWVALPLQGKSKSGLLTPKISFHYKDKHHGIGIRQDYYWYLSPHADCTVGIDWQQQLGLFAKGNCRLARSTDEYSIATGYFGRAWDMFVLRDGFIVQEDCYRYWLQGQDFSNFGQIGTLDVHGLTQVDFGSDKKMGYKFFDNINQVDDSFFNNGVIRAYSDSGVVDFRIDSVETNRKRFADLSAQDKTNLEHFFTTAYPHFLETEESVSAIKQKALVNKFSVVKLPHFEYNSDNRYWGTIASYRYDCFIDRIRSYEYEIEQLYAAASLVSEDPVIPRNTADLFRIEYRGVLRKQVEMFNQVIGFSCLPHYQLRSKIRSNNYFNDNVLERQFTANGSQRIFLEYAIEWKIPEISIENSDASYFHYVQSVVNWQLLPRFYQRHWYHIDQWDKWYPKNELSYTIKNFSIFYNAELDWHFSQGYNFYKNEEIFSLQRTISGSHLLPLRNYIACSYSGITVSTEQEYEFACKKLLTSHINAKFSLGNVDCSFGYLYWNEKAQEQKKLLSNIPHFFSLQCAIPLNKYATLQYGGQFYVEKNSFLRPLIHQIKFEYDAHCWRFYLGFEEKIYREDGKDRRDRMIVLSLHFDSLGSVGQKIKTPYLFV